MTGRIATGLLAASLAVSPAPLFGQTAPQTADAVAPVTVTGERKPPVEMIPAYGACLEAVAKDPTVAALISMGEMPRIYLKTRPPRNPDYSAPPRTPPGSAMPKVMSLKDYERYLFRVGLADWSSDVVDGLASTEDAFSLADPDALAGAEGMSGSSVRREAIAFCLGDSDRGAGVARMGRSGASTRMFSNNLGPGAAGMMSNAQSGPSGPTRPGSGRMEIQMRNESLPLGFALFEDGRYEEALEQFKDADRKIGGGEAALMAGKIYLFGLKEKSDPVEGVKWLKRVADDRFNGWTQTPVFDPTEPELNTATGEACLILATLYATGLGPIAKDPAQTRKYLAKAYEVGHIRAAKMLGDIYYQGIDTPRDPKAAFKAYMDAAKFAYVPAMNAVAQMYADGEAEGAPNPAKAAAWRNEAVKAQNPAAAYSLAVAYDRGEGVEADPDRALALYKLAAMGGEPAAMTALGTYFYRGEAGLPHDPAMARKWFQQAAARGDGDAMVNAAAMMLKGEGGPVERLSAWRWLKLAEFDNQPGAADAVRTLEATMSTEELQAAARLRESSSTGHDW